MSSESHDDHRIGTVVDMYRIEALLGRGGMGAVYRAVHTWTEREVAIKFLLPHLGGNERNTRRFMKEARAATALRHPNVVDVLHMGKDGRDVYLVMELLHGQSLRTLLSERTRLPEAEALAYVLPTMDALVRAHALGVVHRDIKPDNIFLALGQKNEVMPKLLDFGVAKLAEPSGSSGTGAGALLGTPQYMAPEQANCETDVGASADIWAIGMVLYECVTGGLPFGGSAGLPALLLKLVTEDVPSVALACPGLSDHVQLAIDRALRREKVARFGSMEEFATALRANSPAPGVSLSRADTFDEAVIAATGPSAITDSRHDNQASSYGPVENGIQIRSPRMHPRWVLGLAVVLGALGALFASVLQNGRLPESGSDVRDDAPLPRSAFSGLPTVEGGPTPVPAPPQSTPMNVVADSPDPEGSPARMMPLVDAGASSRGADADRENPTGVRPVPRHSGGHPNQSVDDNKQMTAPRAAERATTRPRAAPSTDRLDAQRDKAQSSFVPSPSSAHQDDKRVQPTAPAEPSDTRRTFELPPDVIDEF